VSTPRLVRFVAYCSTLSIAVGAHAEVRRVPQQYATIMGAIGASFDGDVVEVGPGVYAESLNLGGREITVRSTSGAGQTVVDPVSGRCLTVNGQKGNGARVEGFTLRGGSAPIGGGVYVESSSPVLVGCVITGNESTEYSYSGGGGVHVASGSPKLVGCTVSQNTAIFAGGGIYAAGTLTLEDCVVSGNTVSQSQYDSYGGGLYVAGTVTMTGGSVTGNTASLRGGGIYVSGSLNATDVSVVGNVVTRTNGSGGGLYGGGTLQLMNCMVSGNTAGGNGGGLSTSSGTVTVSGSTIEENDAGGYGGGWYIGGSSPLLQSSQVRNNGAATVGGIWVASGQLRVGGTLFCGNGVNLSGSRQDLGGNTFNGQCAPVCPGDSNGDGVVDGRDLGEVLSNWGPCTYTPCYEDFNLDGVINGGDLGVLLNNWGTCATP
jgi:predicted outer membrane repeat protein